MKIFAITKDLSALISAKLLDIFFPKRCLCCQKYGQLLCADCARQIEYIKTDICPECGKISSGGDYCRNCRAKLKTKLSSIIVAANYHSRPVKEMIHNLKYGGLVELSEYLGEILVLKLAKLNLK